MPIDKSRSTFFAALRHCCWNYPLNGPGERGAYGAVYRIKGIFREIVAPEPLAVTTMQGDDFPRTTTEMERSTMSIFDPAPPFWTSRMLSVLRIVAGLVYMTAGTMKLFGFPPMPHGMPPITLASQLGLAAILETFGGAAIVLGLFTRPIAFILAGEMAVAYFQVHFPKSFFPTVSNGVPPVLYCFIYLYLVFAGAGAWGLDAMIARSRGRSQP
jgi:putative oxidoreductase